MCIAEPSSASIHLKNEANVERTKMVKERDREREKRRPVKTDRKNENHTWNANTHEITMVI